MKKRITAAIIAAAMLSMTACGNSIETMSQSVTGTMQELPETMVLDIKAVAASVAQSAGNAKASIEESVTAAIEAKAEAEALAAEEKNKKPSERAIDVAKAGREPEWLDLDKEVTLTAYFTGQDYYNQLYYEYADGSGSGGNSYEYGQFLDILAQLDGMGCNDIEVDVYNCPSMDWLAQFEKDLAERAPGITITDTRTILDDMQAMAEAQLAYLEGQEATSSGVAVSGGKTMSQEKYDAALAVAQSIAASIPAGSDLERIRAAADAVKAYCDAATYRKAGDYNNAYGVFCSGEYTCAGSCRALGMVLECMGYSWTHVNPNQNTHQWVLVNMDGQAGWADGMGGIADYGECPFGWGGSYTDENGVTWSMQ